MNVMVQEYYGKTLQGSADLQTDACCTDEGMPNYLKPVLSNIHDEVMMRYYGCGLVMPEQLEGLSILDLGSGSGRDVYALAQLVGEKGRVVGIDMTDEQLEVANRHIEYHREKFGYAKSNVSFHKGHLETLHELDLEEASFDVIISNCVINLCEDKGAVLSEAYRLLKPGGEMYFSDVYASRRVPEALTKDPVLHGECLSGALYWNDFLTIARESGFIDPRLVTDRPLAISNPAIELKLGNIRFFSATYRLFKLDGLEPACEDYGQAVMYKGTVVHQSEAFELDGHHFIETGRMFAVCGNTYRMLQETRFRDHFDFYGSWDTHFGIFPGCGTAIPYGTDGVKDPVSGDCC